MTEYDNTNRGSIWKNDKKEKDTHPDFTGSLNVNGVEFWVSAWKRKEGAAAKAPALSFSIKPKEEQSARVMGEQSISQRAMPKQRVPSVIDVDRHAPTDSISTGRPRSNDAMSDDIPFAPEFR